MNALEEGSGVVTTRGDVHHVVTEHGIAHLFDKSFREPARAHIDAAHPGFDQELGAAAGRRKLIQMVAEAETSSPPKRTIRATARALWKFTLAGPSRSASRPRGRRSMRSLDSRMALNREQILATIDAHADELHRLGARSLALFGSIARGEGSDSSDIDLLVELQGQAKEK